MRAVGKQIGRFTVPDVSITSTGLPADKLVWPHLCKFTR